MTKTLSQLPFIQLRPNLFLAALALVLMTGALVGSEPAPHALHGYWLPFSRACEAVNGPLTFWGETVTFEKLGTTAFVVLRETPKEIVIETEQELDSCRFIRIGPKVLFGSADSEKIEVAFCKTKEAALQERKTPQDGASSWGIYYRRLSNAPNL